MESTRQLNNPNYRALLVRRTFPKLRELIDRSMVWFQGYGKWNDQKHSWTFPSGAKIILGSCQYEHSKYDYQGHEYAFIGFDQLEEFTETQYLFIIAQNRSSDPNLICYVRSTSNPGNIGHYWVKKRFIDPLERNGEPKWFKRVDDEDIETTRADTEASSRAFVFSTLDDNPSLMENDPQYENRLRLLPSALQKALRWGDWDAFEGQYFGDWRRDIHIVPPFSIPKNWLKIISIDYGFAKPSSVGWWAIGFEGQVFRYRELYATGLTYIELARKILELMPKDEVIDYAAGDPSMWGDKAHHKDAIVGESGAETMQDIFGERIDLLKGDNNRVTGWGRMRQYIKPFKNHHNQSDSKLKSFSTCRAFNRTIPQLIHSETRPEDLDTNGEDHCADECRYFLMSRPLIPEIKIKAHILSRDELIWKRGKEQALNRNQGFVDSVLGREG